MSKKFIIASAALFLFGFQSRAQVFEGVVRFKAENRALSETSEIDWYSKGKESRLDINSHTPQLPNFPMSLYFIQGQSDVQMLMDKKIYSIPFSAFETPELATAFAVEPTGQKGRYAGYDCEEYIIRSNNAETSCWISQTTGISPATSLPPVLSGRGVFAALQRNGVQGFPLKITHRDLAGNVLSDQETISIEPRKLSNELSVPSYEKGN